MLPTKKTVPSTDPMSYSILLYGPTKVGKTTWAAQAEDAIFLASEPGQNALSVYKVDISSWPQFLEVCHELSSTKHRFRTIVIDTIDNVYELCMQHVCARLNVEHPADLDYGKGWGVVNLEFKRVLTKLAAMPQGLICISHSKVKEIKHKTGKYDKIIPTTGGASVVLGLMDMVLMAEVRSVRTEAGIAHSRIIHTKAAATHDAGDRTDKLPAELPLDYAEFIAAFKRATKGSSK
jgi:hypothetical protein